MEKKHIFDNPKNIKRLLIGFFASCVLLLSLDFFIVKEHAHFDCEKWTGFYGVFGFVACVVLVLVSRFILRPLVMRGEDYYE